ncbi:hypothetical protein KHS38_03145 [Mucilaginibacter sp. Bleaf8]|uniref:hypothetical protein n=1 Tax=Mucilaginibacter sp. Bleaf8 TaxID=2834430 RepID=UPI001BD09067|nr:hypothetical protein [Mucilaginibacter sp. Bleaf8]MBS7563389.1 hypothetical protein [Mucilaginibacter sp. Bleaf8]
MKLRVTPLNFAALFFVVLALITWIYKPIAITGRELANWTGTIAIIFLFFALSTFLLDGIFRNFFPQKKTLWTVEFSFLAITGIIYLLVK